MSNVLGNFPSINEILESPPLKAVLERVNRNVVVSGVRSFLDNLRTEAQSAAAGMSVPSRAELAERIARWISSDQQQPLRPAINATGQMLPASLAGVPLAAEAIRALTEAASGYAMQEMQADGNQACLRNSAVEKLLVKLTGAEAALVVHSKPSAALLALAALASGREVLVARGEIVDAGGNCRLTDVIAQSGATLREVGTVNRTRTADFAAAAGDKSGVVLVVHASDFQIGGDTQTPPLEELVALARKQQLPLMQDIGAGGIVDPSRYGIQGEPSAADSIRAGADLVLLAGDKLLGGPACGIVVGRRSAIDRLAQHPLLPILQASKLTLAALQATLELYDDLTTAERLIPLLSLLSTPVENLRNRAERLAPQMIVAGVVSAAMPEQGHASLSGDSLADHQLPTWCIALVPTQGTVAALAQQLQAARPPVIGRATPERLLLDLRTVLPRQDIDLVAAVQSLAKKTEAEPAGEAGAH
jgi:L-seryl-tRNA(Ser) seleniumtransferase